MPRRKVIRGSRGEYKGYRIIERYNYDGKQLDTIIEALEYYMRQSALDKSSDYMVFEITLNVDETTKSPAFNPMDYDDGCDDFSPFNPNSLKTILPADQFYYRWTREYKDDHFMGEHYHLMVIANHFPLREMMAIQKAVANLQGVKTAFISPRVIPKDDHRSKVHFHWLNRDGVDGIEDAVLRHCYRAKLNQKLEGMGRSFDGCRELRPLAPVSLRNQELFIRTFKSTTDYLSDVDTASSSLFSSVGAMVASNPQTIIQEPF